MPHINEKKYKNAILFFAKKTQNGTLGKLKIKKLLYYLDFDFFENAVALPDAPGGER